MPTWATSAAPPCRCTPAAEKPQRLVLPVYIPPSGRRLLVSSEGVAVGWQVQGLQIHLPCKQQGLVTRSPLPCSEQRGEIPIRYV